jgi:hypothetical protein
MLAAIQLIISTGYQNDLNEQNSNFPVVLYWYETWSLINGKT